MYDDDEQGDGRDYIINARVQPDGVARPMEGSRPQNLDGVTWTENNALDLVVVLPHNRVYGGTRYQYLVRSNDEDWLTTFDPTVTMKYMRDQLAENLAIIEARREAARQAGGER